jgi:hypothetical protein
MLSFTILSEGDVPLNLKSKKRVVALNKGAGP